MLLVSFRLIFDDFTLYMYNNKPKLPTKLCSSCAKEISKKNFAGHVCRPKTPAECPECEYKASYRNMKRHMAEVHNGRKRDSKAAAKKESTR